MDKSWEMVVMGLECLADKKEIKCADCYYFSHLRRNGLSRHLHVVAADALALLKAMEPRLLFLEDLRECRRKSKPAYAELKTSILGAPKVFPIVLDYTPVYGGNKRALIAIYGRNRTLAESDYGITWRAWTNAPDEKRMEETPWPEKSK